ncbi:unnamed protein product [Cercospora beticola]|nr:unnamed protein product [Cercospora beticola]
MAADPINRTADLCELLANTELEEMLRRNYVLDPRDFPGRGPPPGHPLERARKETMNLMQNYHKLQEALFDFRGGYCVMCHFPPERRHLDRKHAHGCQGTGVRMVRDIPGMLLYPNFLQEKKVLMKLIDELLLSPEHDFLGDGKGYVPTDVASLMGSIFDLGSRNAVLQVSIPDEMTALD